MYPRFHKYKMENWHQHFNKEKGDLGIHVRRDTGRSVNADDGGDDDDGKLTTAQRSICLFTYSNYFYLLFYRSSGR